MKALIIVDVQNDFCPGGSLSVQDGKAIIPVINRLSTSEKFKLVVATQDWHPKGHVSFASRYGAEPFSTFCEETVWPDHCVQGSWGAELHLSLNPFPIRSIVRKGMEIDKDEYSAFKYFSCTTLAADDIYIVGIATDVCIKATVMDVLAFFNRYHGLSVPQIHVVIDACAGVTVEGTADALLEMERAGAHITNSRQVLK